MGHFDKLRTGSGQAIRREGVIGVSHRELAKDKGRAIRNNVSSNRAMDSNPPSRANRNNHKLESNIFPKPHVINPCPSPLCFRPNRLRAAVADFGSRTAQDRKIQFIRL